jgi:hypothetical protein
VTENTTPVNVSSAVAMVASSVRASSRSVGNKPWWSVKLCRCLSASAAATQAAIAATSGQNHSDS